MFYTNIIIDIKDFREAFIENINNIPKQTFINNGIYFFNIEDLYISIVKKCIDDYFVNKINRKFFYLDYGVDFLDHDIIYNLVQHNLQFHINNCLDDFCDFILKRRINKGIVIESMQVNVTNNTIFLTIGENEKDE